VVADAVLLDQREEILRRVARQRALAEVRILGQEIGGPALMLVKLQRPPPEMRIFSASLAAWSISTTRLPRWAATPRTSCRPRPRRLLPHQTFCHLKSNHACL
jgi:hypothetical protein